MFYWYFAIGETCWCRCDGTALSQPETITAAMQVPPEKIIDPGSRTLRTALWGAREPNDSLLIHWETSQDDYRDRPPQKGDAHSTILHRSVKGTRWDVMRKMEQHPNEPAHLQLNLLQVARVDFPKDKCNSVSTP